MSTAQRKRPRSISPHLSDSSPSPASSAPPSPATKYHRLPSPEHDHLCTLPPTCSQPGTAQSFATLAELDAHQASFHRWVCRVPIRDKPGRRGEGELILVPESFIGRPPAGGGGSKWRECGKMFPDERMLNLHEIETHDPIERERQQRGEKIFQCFLSPDQCSKVFQTPKKRRAHLIEKHHYPETYFFSITNHGLNQIARTDGPAASLIRPRVNVPALASSTAPDSSRHPIPCRPPLDIDMDDLAAQMAGLESSLAFVPRGVRRKPRDVVQV